MAFLIHLSSVCIPLEARPLVNEVPLVLILAAIYLSIYLSAVVLFDPTSST